MTRRKPAAKQKRSPKRVRTVGTGCIAPRGIETRYDISPVSRWRWEKTGRLPPRDVFVGGIAIGWKPATIEQAERGPSQA